MMSQLCLISQSQSIHVKRNQARELTTKTYSECQRLDHLIKRATNLQIQNPAIPLLNQMISHTTKKSSMMLNSTNYWTSSPKAKVNLLGVKITLVANRSIK